MSYPRCDECIKLGGYCQPCWRKREAERERIGGAISRHDTELYNAWVRGDISEQELLKRRHPDGDLRQLKQLIAAVLAKRRQSTGGEKRPRKSKAVYGESK